MAYIKKGSILAEVENYVQGLRNWLDDGYYISSCYSSEEEVVVNLVNSRGDEAVECFSADSIAEEVLVDYFIENLSKLAGRIAERHYCKKVCNKPVNKYEKEILRVINNIIKGEDDPFNKR